MKKKVALIIALVLLIVAVVPTFAAKPAFGQLFYNGEVVRTIIPPASMTKEGSDNIYPFSGEPAEGQLPVAAVAPGDKDYHGGKWAVHVVSWDVEVEPYLLTSEYAILEAEANGDVTITRMPGADFKCPIQP